MKSRVGGRAREDGVVVLPRSQETQRGFGVHAVAVLHHLGFVLDALRHDAARPVQPLDLREKGRVYTALHGDSHKQKFLGLDHVSAACRYEQGPTSAAGLPPRETHSSWTAAPAVVVTTEP